MKVLLMHPDRDFDLEQPLPWNATALVQDLELETLLHAMAGADNFLLQVCRKALLTGLQNDVETILYRQEVLRDSLNNNDVVRQLYALVVETFEKKREFWWGLHSRYPSSTLHASARLLEMLVGMLRTLRGVADERASGFTSTGFTRLFSTLQHELSDDYFATVQHHLTALQFRHGVLLSAELGDINQGVNYTLRQPHDTKLTWFDRILAKKSPGYTFQLDPRDEAGARALSEIQDKGLNLVANAVAQSAEHVLSFFTALQTELAFYIGGLNLHARLTAKDLVVAFPTPMSAGGCVHNFKELYEPCLALTSDRPVVGNTVTADRNRLVIITGANQGGKSTFLRSIGLAQMMMQCGLFVGAEMFSADIAPSVITHYRREEDVTMTSGKFDEELARMSDIVEHLERDALLLFNESLAATNAREGSEIATQIVRAVLEKPTKVFFVTHLYEFAHGFVTRGEEAMFLRAEREPDGTRTFKLIEGEPLDTSYGEDLYREVFAEERTPVPSAQMESHVR